MSGGDIAAVGQGSVSQPPNLEATYVTEDVTGGTWLEGGTSISNVTDMVDKVDKLTDGGRKCLNRLILVSHGSEGQDGFIAFDAETTGGECIDGGASSNRSPILNPTVTEQLQRLGKFMCPKGKIELRICRSGSGGKGTRALQAIADATGVAVSAPMDKIKSIMFFGGLSVSWKTVYPTAMGVPPVESFWRDPTPPPDAAYVPLRGVNPTSLVPPATLPRPPGQILTRVTVPVAVGVAVIGTAVGVAVVRPGSAPVAPVTPAAATATPAPVPSPVIGRISATFERPVTSYEVTLTGPGAGKATFTWTRNGATCGSFIANGDQARWSHPDASLGGNCPDEPVHPALIRVEATVPGWTCDAFYFAGSAPGQGDPGTCERSN